MRINIELEINACATPHNCFLSKLQYVYYGEAVWIPIESKTLFRPMASYSKLILHVRGKVESEQKDVDRQKVVKAQQKHNKLRRKKKKRRNEGVVPSLFDGDHPHHKIGLELSVLYPHFL